MSWTWDLLEGIAEYAAAGGVALWRPDGLYTEAEAGLLIAARPPAPDRIVTLDEYGPLDEDGLGDVTVGLQARFRGAANDPRSAKALRDAFRDRINGLEHVRLGGVVVSHLFHTSSASLGFDANNRLELTSNFTVQTQHITALRTD